MVAPVDTLSLIFFLPSNAISRTLIVRAHRIPYADAQNAVLMPSISSGTLF
jgi:hypothetical protein